MSKLEDYRMPVKLKLAMVWASTMFCYIYCDFFGLFVPGALVAMNRGTMGPLGAVTPVLLVCVSMMMAVPSLMIALSLLLPAAPCRWANIALGSLYTTIMLVSLPGSPPFYILYALIEIGLTVTIAVVAWRWPRRASEAALNHEGSKAITPSAHPE